MPKTKSDVEARLLSKGVGMRVAQQQENGTASTNAHSYIRVRNVAVTTILPSEQPLLQLGYTKVNLSK